MVVSVENLRLLVLKIVEAVVDSPDQVEVEAMELEGGAVEFRATVAPEDMGQVVGRRGATVGAIRRIIEAACVREDKKGPWVYFEINEPGG